jgi:hypothetical protein
MVLCLKYRNKNNKIKFFFTPQNFPQSHQLITTLNGSVTTSQTLSTTTAAFNNNLNHLNGGGNHCNSNNNNNNNSEDEITKKLPKEILLRILSYLDVVSLCRCAQVLDICITILLLLRNVGDNYLINNIIMIQLSLHFHAGIESMECARSRRFKLAKN